MVNDHMDRMTAFSVFREVAETGSFAGASRRLSLSPPAISKNIKELEAYLGARLIDRTTRRMHLTEAGTVYLEHVTRALDELDDAGRALGALQAAPSGKLRVSAPVTFTLTCLSGVMPRFLGAYPAITLELDLNDRRVDLIAEGYDIAIRGADALDDSTLVAARLMTMRHVVCAAPAYLEAHGRPEVPQDLTRHDCIKYSLSSHADRWEFLKEQQGATVAVSGRYSITSSLGVRDALLAGFGIGLIPYPYVRDDILAGRLIVLLEDWSGIESVLHAVYPSRRHISPKVRAFIDFIAAHFRNEHG